MLKLYTTLYFPCPLCFRGDFLLFEFSCAIIRWLKETENYVFEDGGLDVWGVEKSSLGVREGLRRLIGECGKGWEG